MEAIFLILMAMYLWFIAISFAPDEYGEYLPAKPWIIILSFMAALCALIVFFVEFFV